MPSAIAYFKEMIRREVTGDDKFFTKMMYFFELQVPAEAWPLGSLLFPLVLAPESISFEEPFAVEHTQTQGGGLIVEENGIIQRRLIIRGQTGWKPRKLTQTVVTGLITTPAEKRSFDRTLNPLVLDAISGQRHFQYLQDSVFRTYADLKQDPDSAKDTKLFFHSLKDDEHWEVVPISFTMDRNNTRRTLYQYNINLLVVGKASKTEFDFSEDKGLLDSLKDGLRQINNAISLVRGAIQDLTNIVNEVKSYVAAIGTILTNAVSIIDAATAFVEGVTSLVQLPAKMIQDLHDQVDGSLASFEEAIDRLAATGEVYEDLGSSSKPGTGATDQPMPQEVLRALQDIKLGCDLMLMNPSVFETPLQERLRLDKEAQALSTVASAEELATAAEAEAPTTFDAVNAIGSGLMPGDVERANVELTPSGSDAPNYTNAQEIVVEQGDTLSSIAARKLGDARRWQELAVLNNMKPPYITGAAAADIEEAYDEEAVPGAMGTGKKLLIPNYKRPLEARPLLPVLGVPAQRDVEEKLLGSDLALTRMPGEYPRYDVEIDIAGGSVDAKRVVGMPNLRQAIEMRLVIERGTDILFKKVGLEPIVGVKWTPLDRELVRFRVLRTISADPRILGVRKILMQTLTEGMPEDAVEIDADVDVIGFTQAATIKSTL